MTTDPAIRKRILLVEDNAIIRVGTAMVLHEAGYEVAAVTNGREALNVLSSLELVPLPDLILADMMMPVCDGWQFLREWRQHPAAARVPVIIMTALAVASPEWAKSLGALALVRVPVEPDELLAVLRCQLGQ